MVEINNLTTIEIDQVFVEKIIDEVLKGEGGKEGEMVSVAFLGPGRMRKLNKTYRQKNRVTDVLSFAENKVSFGQFKIGPLQKAQGLGEIVICPREAKKNVKDSGLDFMVALKKVIIHGVLHLLGYDHEKSEAEAKKMEEKEEQYLKISDF